MYDFANSGYTTVVITAIFNAYFVSVVARNAAWATFAWTGALAISYAAIVASAPLVGALADLRAAKKKMLALTTVGCVATTAALALVGPGELALGILLVALSNTFYGTGENLVAAFLPELARGEALGKVSGWGWSLGYLGGLLALGLSLAYVSHAQSVGAVFFYQIQRIDVVAERLADFAPFIVADETVQVNILKRDLPDGVCTHEYHSRHPEK